MCGKATISEVCSEKYLGTKANKPAADRATNFETPICNVWNQHEKTDRSSHFGNSASRDAIRTPGAVSGTPTRYTVGLKVSSGLRCGGHDAVPRQSGFQNRRLTRSDGQ